MSLRQRIGLTVFVVLGVVGMLGPLLVAPPRLELARDLQGPALAGGLGRGEGGVDVVSCLLYGTRGALLVGVSVMVLAMGVAVGLGLLHTLGPAWARRVIDRAVDVTLAFPSLLLAAALTALMPPSLTSVIVVLALTSWAAPTRLLAALMRQQASHDHVRAAVALGASPTRVALVHILPLVRAGVGIQASQVLSGAIIAEAGLAFLGLTAPPLTPPLYASWGGVLDDGVAVLFAAPHLWWPPALALFLVAVAAQLVSPEREPR